MSRIAWVDDVPHVTGISDGDEDDPGRTIFMLDDKQSLRVLYTALRLLCGNLDDGLFDHYIDSAVERCTEVGFPIRDGDA